MLKKNNPIEDVDKILKVQLEKEKIEAKRKKEEKKVLDMKKELEKGKRKNKDENFDFMSPSEINKIKKNLNNNKNEGKNEDTFYKNKNTVNLPVIPPDENCFGLFFEGGLRAKIRI